MHKRIADFARTRKYIKNVRMDSDSRVDIRHFITWPTVPTPTISQYPESSSHEMTTVKKRYTMSTDETPERKTKHARIT